MSIAFYEANAEDFFRRTVDVDMAPGWAAFTAAAKPGGRVLDAGCGSGRDALAFHSLGFKVSAMEGSAKLASLAQAHTGLPVEGKTFEEITWREAFDGVWARASLLHVPRTELCSVTRRIRNALVPGGVWWMSFKYGTEEREVAGRRFTDLDEAGAQALIDDVGGLTLIAIEVSFDARIEQASQRWLSVLCRGD